LKEKLSLESAEDARLSFPPLFTVCFYAERNIPKASPYQHFDEKHNAMEPVIESFTS
jgi:hypothetical protein